MMHAREVDIVQGDFVRAAEEGVFLAGVDAKDPSGEEEEEDSRPTVPNDEEEGLQSALRPGGEPELGEFEEHGGRHHCGNG